MKHYDYVEPERLINVSLNLEQCLPTLTLECKTWFAEPLLPEAFFHRVSSPPPLH